MTARALLIGSQTFGLEGVHNDVDAIGDYLAGRGFERRVLTDADATREGILDGLRALVRDTTEGEPALLYYSGHGGWIANPKHGMRAGEPRHYACIIPTDHTKALFRGIFSAELSALMAELALVTRNITVILDCCHAAAQVKGGLRPRAIPVPWREDVEAHRDWLLAQGYDLSARAAYVEGNPHAVRLVACRADQVAYERGDDDGRDGGIFTRALLEVLTAGRAPTTWHALAELVHARVTAEQPTQEPELHGPLGRQLFGVDEAPITDVLALTERDGEPFLAGGALHGVTWRSRYLLMPPNAGRGDPALAIGEAEVVAVLPHIARVALQPRDPAAPPPLGTRAFLHDPQLHHHAVRLDLPAGPLRDRLTARIAASPRLVVASDETEGQVAATVAPGEEGLLLRDRDGHLIHAPRILAEDPSSDVGLAEIDPAIVAHLEQLARVRDLLDQPEPVGATRLAPAPTVRWGRLRRGQEEALPRAGAELSEGDRFFVRVTSHSPSPIYVSIVGVGVSRSIRLLTVSEPAGVRLETQETYTLGEDMIGQLPGIALVWPAEFPRSAPQPMALVVVATDVPVDLRSLESSAVTRAGLEKSLDELLEPNAHTTTKDFGGVPVQARGARYHRFTVTLHLSPCPPVD